MSDFKFWLQSVGLEKYGEVFASHDIDLMVAPELTEQDLEKIGLSLGHRRKFITAAAKLRAAPVSSLVVSAQAQPVNAGAKMHRLAGAKIHQRFGKKAPELGAFSSGIKPAWD
jgi:hypothetical protein